MRTKIAISSNTAIAIKIVPINSRLMREIVAPNTVAACDAG